MNEPTVCCVMLTRDRPELAAKAVECFRRQTYENKRLIIWDTSPTRYQYLGFPDKGIHHCFPHSTSCIGGLRNEANKEVGYWFENQIFVHFDDDDWSHPNRIAEQVAFLQMSGADVVGYNQMLFWRSTGKCGEIGSAKLFLDDAQISSGPIYGPLPDEAWLYTAAAGLTPALGTSLCYWRKTWERQPFNPALPKTGGGMSEETEFLRGLKCATTSALHCGNPATESGFDSPAMIARIHGANFGKYDIENQIARGSNAKHGEGWARVPEWDRRVREILA